ncbi:MAG: glycosyltransferase family 2 protein [Saprospiraceae bacterium]|nr:glycosyltransferase family 2 protein [Saprospiraceae bacterium]
MNVLISVVIITKNEARNIGRCLDSVQSVADEVVVVDSYSTDDTKAICLARKVRFVEHPFYYYSAQKNYATQCATFDYILSLDADEALSETLILAIQNLKSNWSADAYTMNRLNNYCGQWIRHSGWYPDKKIRLFDRRKAQWGDTNPHERVLLQAGATLGHLSGDLLHYSYASISEHVQKMNYYTDLMAKAAFEAGKKASIFKIIWSPWFNFLKKYILKLGFLDGYYGFVVCVMAGYYNFLKYVKLRALHRASKS